MSDLLLALSAFGFGGVVGLASGMWKAAKMQALREANQARFDRAAQAIEQGTRIAQHIQPSRPRPHK